MRNAALGSRMKKIERWGQMELCCCMKCEAEAEAASHLLQMPTIYGLEYNIKLEFRR
jgi:hypothetical protein